MWKHTVVDWTNLQTSTNSVIVPFSKLGDKVAMWSRKGSVESCSSLSRSDLVDFVILS